MNIEISQKARNDLQSIYDYLHESFGARIAEEKLQEIKKDINLLGEMPFFGKAVAGTGLRMLVSGMAIIIYDVMDKVLEILHIIDGRSDYAKTLFLQ